MLKQFVITQLKQVIKKMESDDCELSEEEINEIMHIVGHQVMSKAQAYEYLNMSRSKFDALVLDGKLPKGKKRLGFKELVWYKDELDSCRDL